MKKMDCLELGRKALELQNKGYSYRKIALELGSSPETVRRKCKIYSIFLSGLENGTFEPVRVNKEELKETMKKLEEMRAIYNGGSF